MQTQAHTDEHHDDTSLCAGCGQDAPSEAATSMPEYWMCVGCIAGQDDE